MRLDSSQVLESNACYWLAWGKYCNNTSLPKCPPATGNQTANHPTRKILHHLSRRPFATPQGSNKDVTFIRSASNCHRLGPLGAGFPVRGPGHGLPGYGVPWVRGSPGTTSLILAWLRLLNAIMHSSVQVAITDLITLRKLQKL